MFLNRKDNAIILDSGPKILNCVEEIFQIEYKNYNSILSNGFSQYLYFETVDKTCAYKKNVYEVVNGKLHKNSEFIGNVSDSIDFMCALTEDVIEIHSSAGREILNFRDNKFDIILVKPDEEYLWLNELRCFNYHNRLENNRLIIFDDNIVVDKKIYNQWKYIDCCEFNYDNFMFIDIFVQPRVSFCAIYYVLRKKYKLPKPLVIIIIEMGWTIPYH